MAGNKNEEDKVQDMRDGWVDGSCSELLGDLFNIAGALVFLAWVILHS